MKKLILGCTLMLCGMIGMAAWMLSAAVLAEPGAWSTPLRLFSGLEGLIALLFFAVAAAGFALSLRGLKGER